MFTIYPRTWLQLVKPFPEMPILVSMEVTRIAIGYGGHIDPYQRRIAVSIMIHIFPESLAIVDLRCFLSNDYIKIYKIAAVKRGNLPTRPSERYQPSFSNSCPIKSPLSSAGGNLSMKTLIIFLCLTTTAWAQPWPQAPPKIGRLELKQEYWDYIKEAAQRYQISPYLIQAVCAIESRYDPEAKSGRCFGLMQMHVDTAEEYGVNNPLN